MKKSRCFALIFAGGVGVRVNNNGVPKQFLKVKGVPIIIRTIRKFDACATVDSIVLVCVEGYQDYLQTLLDDYGIKKVVRIVKGGVSGQESIYNGLRAISSCPKDSDAVVLIHDAVRPIISSELITECVQSTRLRGSGVAAVLSHESIASRDEDSISQIYPRDEIVFLKAPQAFFFNDIWKYHNMALNDGVSGVTDSATLAKKYGHNIFLVRCNTSNIKVTYPEDVYVLKALLDFDENVKILGI